MKAQFRLLMKTLPSIPVYFYLLFLALTSTGVFIVLLMMVA